MPHVISNRFYGIQNPADFQVGMSNVIASIPHQGLFAGDNLFTFGKNLSFMRDERFAATLQGLNPDDTEISCIWRTSTLCWAARNALRVEGDFAETGTYRGYSARFLCDYLGFNDTGRRFFLYDLFEHNESVPRHAMTAHGESLYGEVVDRFKSYPGVQVIKGRVPDSFGQGEPEKIAFLHIDLNSAEAEISVLDRFFDRIVPGGMIVFDDYGWMAYARQKEFEDAWLAQRGYQIMEMPTGQGLLVKY